MSRITEVAENTIKKTTQVWFTVVEGSGFGWDEESITVRGESFLCTVEEDSKEKDSPAFIFLLRVHQVKHNSVASTTVVRV